MKKIIILIVFLVNILSANAIEHVKVTAENDFNTLNPVPEIDFKIEQDFKLGNNQINAGSLLHCNVIKVRNSKRGKINAAIYVEPVYYSYNEETMQIEEKFKAKYAKNFVSKEMIKEIDKGKIVEKAAITAGGHFVKALGPSVSLAEGFIKNEEGNRLKSATYQLYKDSPLSYLSKGKELEISTGDSFYLIFFKNKSKNKEDNNTEIDEYYECDECCQDDEYDENNVNEDENDEI